MLHSIWKSKTPSKRQNDQKRGFSVIISSLLHLLICVLATCFPFYELLFHLQYRVLFLVTQLRHISDWCSPDVCLNDLHRLEGENKDCLRNKRSYHQNTLHSSPFGPKPLCLSAFRGVKSYLYLFTYSSPLFTDRHKKDWNLFSMVKNGLKAQKLLAQGIALGIIAISKAPCKGKSFMFCLEF